MSSLLAALSRVDQVLFHRINQVWTHPWLDAFFPFLTDLDKSRVAVWGALPVLLSWWLYKQRVRAVKVILAVALAVGLTDAVSHRFIKPGFQRARPGKAGVSVVLRTREHAGYSFPSNHAANSFAGAAVLSAAYPPLRWAAFTAAFLVAYSRVYVGVHFPFDVLSGALLGLSLGWMAGLALLRLGLAAKASRKKA